MKKTIALTLLLLANIAILVHAIIPHHHDDKGEICVASHSTDCAYIHKQCEANHHCHDSNHSEECSLKKICVRFDNDKAESYSNSDDYIYHELTLCLNRQDVKFQTNLINLPFRQKPHLISCHTEIFTQSTGLRAPPI